MIYGVLWTNMAESRWEGDQPAWSALTGQTEEDYRGYGWVKSIQPTTGAAWHSFPLERCLRLSIYGKSLKDSGDFCGSSRYFDRRPV